MKGIGSRLINADSEPLNLLGANYNATKQYAYRLTGTGALPQ